jgi:hypothetical protein
MKIRCNQDASQTDIYYMFDENVKGNTFAQQNSSQQLNTFIFLTLSLVLFADALL